MTVTGTSRTSTRRPGRRSAWLPLIIVLFVWSLTTHGKFSNSGDEPHYLAIARSLIEDHDLNLENNYTAPGLEAGPHVRRNLDGALWSVHDIGLPCVLAPIVAAADAASRAVPAPWLESVRQTPDLFAYSLVSLSLVGLVAWAAWLLQKGLAPMAPRFGAAAILAMTLSPPVLSHAFLIFPETLAFVVTAVVVYLVSVRDTELRLTPVILATLAVGCLPWLHRKFSFYAFGLMVWFVVTHRAWLMGQGRRTIGVLAAGLLVPQLALHWWTLAYWGGLGGPHMAESVPFSLSGFPRGALGMILDRERGLFPYAPIYLVAPACFALAWRASRLALVPIALLYLPLAAFVTWDAGFSPAARFLMPLMPVVLFAAVRGLRYQAVRRALIPLTIVQAVIAALVWQNPRLLWPRGQANNELLERVPIVGAAYAHGLPSLMTGDSIAWGFACLLAVAAGSAALWLLAIREDSPGPTAVTPPPRI